MHLRLLIVFLTVFCSGFAFALEWDLTVPGAKTRLGFGGGFFNGAWSTLRLEVSGAGAYRLKLSSINGRFRDGFTPVTGLLMIPEGSGVRVQTLLIPLSNHAVQLTLEGEVGSKTVKLEPFDAAVGINLTDDISGIRGQTFELSPHDLPSNPGLLLGIPEIVVSSSDVKASGLLVALAAGAQVYLKPESKQLGLLTGTVGLGRVEHDFSATKTPQSVQLESLAKLLVPRAKVPTRNQLNLGWWAVAGFLVMLGLYSARRFEQRFVIGTSLVILLFGFIGFWALSPQTRVTEKNLELVIGAQGWGLSQQLVGRLDLQTGSVLLPAGAKLFGSQRLEYLTDGVRLLTKAWQATAYMLPPKARTMPVKVVNQQIVNLSKTSFTDVFVVGFGQQEPLEAGAKIRFHDSAITGLYRYEMLPKGTVVARVNKTDQSQIFVALPEETP